MIIIYENGSIYANDRFGFGQIQIDGTLEVVFWYTLYSNLSDNFNTLILNNYALSDKNYYTGNKLEFVRFGEYNNSEGKQERINQRLKFKRS